MKIANTFGIQFIIRGNKKTAKMPSFMHVLPLIKKRIEISLKGRIDPLTWDYLRECLKGGKL